MGVETGIPGSSKTRHLVSNKIEHKDQHSRLSFNFHTCLYTCIQEHISIHIKKQTKNPNNAGQLAQQIRILYVPPGDTSSAPATHIH